MPSAYLPDRSLIDIGGTDAESFLHNIITTDVEGLPVNQARPGALLTPQGKILFDFLIWRSADGFALECDATERDALMKRLSMYKLRAAVTLQSGQTGVTTIWGETAKEASGAIDGAFGKAGILLRRQPGGTAAADPAAYDALRIDAGIAVAGKDYAPQDAFPHDVLLDLNGGLSFRKGCYIGQEVVSRMQHRGTARRRVAQIVAQEALPPTGTELTVDGKPVGALGTVIGNQALAIVRIDRVGDALSREAPILAGHVPVVPSLPEWTGLSFPREADEAQS